MRLNWRRLLQNLLDSFNHALKEKCPLSTKKKIFSIRKYRRPTCVVARGIFHEIGHELLPQPPYSKDIAPSDYFLCTIMKKWRKIFALIMTLLRKPKNFFLVSKARYLLCSPRIEYFQLMVYFFIISSWTFYFLSRLNWYNLIFAISV